MRNCRYMCSIAMHTGDMTVDEATEFFVENAYMGEHPAPAEKRCAEFSTPAI